MIDYTFNENKGYSAGNNNPRKKAHCIADKTIVVIDDSLVKCLSIDDDTWFEQDVTEEGILLRISDKSKGIDVN
jgi:hypothetical protein